MTFQHIGNVDMNEGDFLTCHLHGFRAMDTDRHLVLEKTHGRTRNAPHWYVHRYNPNTLSIEWGMGKVTFRAWTFAEAMERLNEPAIAKKIDKLAAK